MYTWFFLFRYLCFEATNPNEGVPRTSPNYDPIWRVRFVVDHLNNRFRDCYQPTKNICVDEVMVPFKGRVAFRQYMKAKPHKWGVKLWALAESESGYVVSFDVYTGKTDRTQTSLSTGVVLLLLTRSRLTGQGYHLYMDNFYTSVDLLSKLWENHSTPACGTVRLGRRGIPSTVVSKKPANLGKERGAAVFCQNGPLLVMAWRDRRIVFVMTSIHSPAMGQVERSVRVDNKFARQAFPAPVAVSQYTANMGGVDHADQLAQYYLPNRKSRKWNVKVVTYLMEMSVVNSYLLLRKTPNAQPTGRTKPMSLLKFTTAVVNSLVQAPVVSIPRGRPGTTVRDERLTSRCMPATFDSKSWCHVCHRRANAVEGAKRHQTKYGCFSCEKHLCIPDCFTAYHTRAVYWVWRVFPTQQMT